MLDFYQNFPQYIDPIIFSIGSFSIRWYSLMYLIACFVVYLLLQRKIFKNKGKIVGISKKDFFSLFSYIILGVLLGGRLGYVFFYNLSYYLRNPLEVLIPVQITDFGLQFTGFFGMSFYGGLIGVIIAIWIFSQKKKIIFWELADFIVPAIPAGYFFGRVGNFLNGELYGRVTDKFWGMNFGDGFLRHPSQLYEAFLEGILLFFVLQIAQRRMSAGLGKLSLIFVLGYSSLRFFVEFFRAPDDHLGLIFWNLTLGHFISFTVIIISIFFLLLKSEKYDNLKLRK